MSKLLFFPPEKKTDFKADVQRPQKQVEHSTSSPLHTSIADCPAMGADVHVPKGLAIPICRVRSHATFMDAAWH